MTLEYLQAARQLLSSPERWTQYALARDRYDRWLGDPLDPNAVCWCAIGALAKVDANRTASDLVAAAAERVTGRGLVNLNDAPTTTHAVVMAVFDAAIADAKERNASENLTAP